MSQLFSYESHQVRTLSENGETWFAAVDVCRCLGLTWSGATLKAIPKGWQRMLKFNTPSGAQGFKAISEPAVYKLAFRSNKPEADAFTNWVASEVLPAIRKTGKFEASPRQMHPRKALPAPEQLSLPSHSVLLDERVNKVRGLVAEMNVKRRDFLLALQEVEFAVRFRPVKMDAMVSPLSKTLERHLPVLSMTASLNMNALCDMLEVYCATLAATE